MIPDPRRHAVRRDLADRRLATRVAAPCYVDGMPAVVATGLAPVRREPHDGAPVDTYFFYGETILAFARDSDHVWCQSAFDDYVGYVRHDRVAIGRPLAGGHFVAAMGAYRYREPDLRSERVDFLPRHAEIRLMTRGIMTRDMPYAELADGTFLPEPCVAESPPRSRDIVAAAALYIGCPYLWAGKSFLGIDCSGLVQNAFRDIGIAVPRDTDMQREAIGQSVTADDAAQLRRGDLLFLPGHVMIYEGAGTVIHADGRRMAVVRETLDGFLAQRAMRLSALAVQRPTDAAAVRPDRAGISAPAFHQEAASP
jgi:cell wall-associated NlpC family hydrolase